MSATPATHVARRGPDPARDTGTVALLTLVSRVTGAVRLLVVAGVLGTTFLGNTYQSANSVPNVVFELVAAGVLTAVLLPTLVRLFDSADPGEGEHVARSVLGLVGAALAVLAVVGFAAAPAIMRGLLAAAPSDAVRDDQVRVGTFLLRCFMPQLVLYAAGMVATGVLHARGRFALAAVAPVVNNVVVTATYAAFWALTRDGDPGLGLSTGEQLVLGLGTTLGVAAFCAVPVIAVHRAGVSLRPRFDHRHPEVRRLGRLGGWAAVQLGCTQLLLVVVLVLSNAVEGGVVAYQVAFTLFLLPHAVVALPVATALYPALARSAASGDAAGFRATTADGLRAVLLLTALPAVALVVLAIPLSEVVLFGAAVDGASQVAGAVAGFGPGLVGYGALAFLTRACYAAGDTRSPAIVHLAMLVGGAAGMVLGVGLWSDQDRVAVIAGVHAVTHLVGAAVLLRPARAAAGHASGTSLVRPVITTALSAILAGSAMAVVGLPLGAGSRGLALVAVLVSGAAGAAVYALAQRLVGGVRLATVPALLRGQVAS